MRRIVRRDPQASNLDEAIKSDFVAALNRLLNRRYFYQAAHFKRVALTDEAEALLSRKPSKLSIIEIQRLNRLLLKASYPNEISESDEIIIQGSSGFGDDFMLGTKRREELPEDIKDSVLQIYEQAASSLGPVRFEWVRDRERVWIVQFHRGITATTGMTIYPGQAKAHRRFDVTRGIGALRTLIAKVRKTKDGIILVGDVGITSHLGDLLRRAKIPSRIEPSEPDS
jgi:hypothetical protein